MDPAKNNRSETRFLSGLTHELRTPMGSILMLAELLGDNRSGALADKDLEYVAKIQQAVTDVCGLIDDVSLLNKINAGRMGASATDVSLRQFARRLEDTHRSAAEEKKLRLEVSCDDDLPGTQMIDGGLLEQILDILVANAVRTTAAGEIRVNFGGLPSGGLEIWVRDGAPTVPADQRQAIFEPFGHTGPQTRRKLGGQSLALPIARRISRLLGGDLALSGWKDGNLFILSLPLASTPPDSATIIA